MTNLLLALAIGVSGSGPEFEAISQWATEPNVVAAYSRKMNKPMLIVVGTDDNTTSRLYSLFTERLILARLRCFVPYFARKQADLDRIKSDIKMPKSSSIIALDSQGRPIGYLAGLMWLPTIISFLDRVLEVNRKVGGENGVYKSTALCDVLNGSNFAPDMATQIALTDRLRFEGKYKEAVGVIEKSWNAAKSSSEIFETGVRYGMTLISCGRYREACAIGEEMSLHRALSADQKDIGMTICRRSGFGEGAAFFGPDRVPSANPSFK